MTDDTKPPANENTPDVGRDIEDSCGRCGDTWHTVAAKVGNQVVKVVCKLCGTQHNYRNVRSPAAQPRSFGGDMKRRTRRRTASIAPTPTPAPTFDPSRPPRPYAPGTSFQAGDRVQHPTFGMGVVTGHPGPGKVDVKFPSGARVLACAKESSDLERPTRVDVPIADRPPDTSEN